MAKIHLNWSGCRDWAAARGRLARVLNEDKPVEKRVTLYSNFCDCNEHYDDLLGRLREVGFEVHPQIPNRGDDACFVLYGVN